MSIEKGGFDVWMTIPGFEDVGYIELRTNICTSSGSTINHTNFRVGLDNTGYYISALSDELGLWDQFYFTSVVPYELRFCMHNEFLSFYANDMWIHTIYFPNVNYPEYEDMEFGLYSTEAITVEDIVVVDLCDWREAIYIDLDTVAANAISSVIQQRPVEIRSTYLGESRFHYSNDDKRDTVALYKGLVKKINIRKDSSSVISDAIVYGPVVEVITRNESARGHGFITKIIRVPELDTGARRAAKEIMKQLEQQTTMYTIITRSDLRIEEGDIVQFTAVLSGTNTPVSVNCIVETTQINLKNATFEMTISGRSYV